MCGAAARRLRSPPQAPVATSQAAEGPGRKRDGEGAGLAAAPPLTCDTAVLPGSSDHCHREGLSARRPPPPDSSARKTAAGSGWKAAVCLLGAESGAAPGTGFPEDPGTAGAGFGRSRVTCGAASRPEAAAGHVAGLTAGPSERPPSGAGAGLEGGCRDR